MSDFKQLSRSVKGLTVLVTGAAGGMGRATARVFAAEGAAVTDFSAGGRCPSSLPGLTHGCLARSMLVMPRSPWRGQREYSCAVARRGLHVVRSQIWTVVARGVA